MLRVLLLENPVLIKHIRARLRRQHLLPLTAIVIMVCGAIVWSGAVHAGIQRDEATAMLNMLVGMQAVILLLVGTSRVAASVAEARESGMLDFHRISPQHPIALTAGFLLGGPVREYVLFAWTLPFSLFLALLAGLSPLRWLAIVLATVAVALLYHAIALVVALTLPDFRGSGAGIIVLLVLLHMAVGPAMIAGLPLAYFTVIPTTAAAIDPSGADQFARASFLGQPLSALLLSLLHQGLLLVFLLIAAARKLRDELANPYAKPVAVLFYLLIAALTVFDVTLGPRHGPYSIGLGSAAAIYIFLAVGLLLCLAVTPGRGQFDKGVRHARKLGLLRVPAWSDSAANWAPLTVFGVILLAAGLAASLAARPHSPAAMGSAAAAGVAALTLLYFGCAKQSLDLAYPKSSTSYLALLLFVLWALPLLVGILFGISAPDDAAVKTFFSFSPLAGVHLAFSEHYRLGWPLAAKAALVASLLPAIGFALLCRSVVRRATVEATPAQ